MTRRRNGQEKTVRTRAYKETSCEKKGDSAKDYTRRLDGCVSAGRSVEIRCRT